jgi:hypothetical protein
MGSGTTTATVGLLTLGSQVPIYVQDDGVTRTDAVSDITITVTGTDVYIESCTVWEVPRVSLSRDATDNGIAMDTLFPRRSIVDSGAQSVRGVAALMQAIDGRRIGHFARWGEQISAATFTHAPYRVVPRAHPSGVRTIRVYVYARYTGAATNFTATSSLGSSSVSISSLTLAWYSVDVDVVAEDPDKPDGVDAGGYDTITLTQSGAGTVHAESWNGVEFA